MPIHLFSSLLAINSHGPWYTADKIDRYDFRGNVGIVLMDFAAASHATMTYGQTYSNMQVYGDDLVRAVICNNNKWNLRRNE